MTYTTDIRPDNNRRRTPLSVAQRHMIDALPNDICQLIFEQAEVPLNTDDTFWGDRPVWEVGNRTNFVEMLVARLELQQVVLLSRVRLLHFVSKKLDVAIQSGRVIFHDCECRAALSDAEQLKQEVSAGIKALELHTVAS